MLARESKADALMKGSLHIDVRMGAVVKRGQSESIHAASYHMEPRSLALLVEQEIQ